MTDTSPTPSAIPNADTVPPPPKRRIPSDRNRRVWVEVVLAQRPQPEVAKEFGITQQRVSQIVDQFQLWLAENLPAGTEGMDPERQLSLVVNTTYLRQEHLFANAMRKLDQSVEDKHSLRIRYSATGEELWRETLRENQSGKSGYLGVALNAATKQVRLVQMAAGLLGPALNVDWHHGDSVAREPDRFRCERSERIRGAGVSPAEATSTDPAAGGTPAPSKPSQPLCDSSAIASSNPPLAVTPGAATSVVEPACGDVADRNGPPQEVRKFFAKSCVGHGEEPAKPLCETASPDVEPRVLTLHPADATGQTIESCAPGLECKSQPLARISHCAAETGGLLES